MTTGSLLPEIVNAVIAVAPMNTVCQSFGKEKGITFLLKSTWSFHGKDLPYTPFLTEKFPLNHVSFEKPANARIINVRPL